MPISRALEVQATDESLQFRGVWPIAPAKDSYHSLIRASDTDSYYDLGEGHLIGFKSIQVGTIAEHAISFSARPFL